MFEIGPISQTPSADAQQLTVETFVRNVGTRTSRDVKVWVTALDVNGARVKQVEVLPEPQAIPPGGAARVVVQMPNDPAIRTFHVEAFGR